MKKLLFIVLASTVGISACASNGTSNGSSDRNHQRPAMSADMKQAMNDCAQRVGVKMNKDSRPSKNDMKKIDSCISAKGFEKPAGQGRH